MVLLRIGKCARLFRQCLNVIARALGFATSTRREPVTVKLDEAGAPDKNDPAMHADVGDLSRSDLRRGRSNGNDR
jgi:hypothetical protein